MFVEFFYKKEFFSKKTLRTVNFQKLIFHGQNKISSALLAFLENSQKINYFKSVSISFFVPNIENGEKLCNRARFSFFVRTFVTKVTEYLFSGDFFLQTNLDFLTSHFSRRFSVSFEMSCC